jgi:hypothetical protein
MFTLTAARRIAAATALIAAASVVALPAQTVFTTFGAGDAFTPGGYPATSPENFFGLSDVADEFTYTGASGKVLSMLRFAAFSEGSNPVQVEFLDGSDISTATVLESWSVNSGGSNSKIYSLTSAAMPTLTNGDIYWVELLAPSGATDVDFIWDQSSVAAGNAYQFGFGNWFHDPSPVFSNAFDVTVADAPSSTTPEPGTLVMMATGLVGVAGMARRKKA